MSETPRADFWFALLLIAFGTAAGAEAWRMPRLDNLGVHPMSVPGLTPGLLAVVLVGLGLALLARSVRRRGHAPEQAPGGGWARLAGTLALCLCYALLLLGRMPFWAATALFVFAFVMAFSWRRRPLGQAALRAAPLALAAGVAVSLLFEKVFLVRLP